MAIRHTSENWCYYICCWQYPVASRFIDNNYSLLPVMCQPVFTIIRLSVSLFFTNTSVLHFVRRIQVIWQTYILSSDTDTGGDIHDTNFLKNTVLWSRERSPTCPDFTLQVLQAYCFSLDKLTYASHDAVFLKSSSSEFVAKLDEVWLFLWTVFRIFNHFLSPWLCRYTYSDTDLKWFKNRKAPSRTKTDKVDMLNAANEEYQTFCQSWDQTKVYNQKRLYLSHSADNTFSKDSRVTADLPIHTLPSFWTQQKKRSKKKPKQERSLKWNAAVCVTTIIF